MTSRFHSRWSSMVVLIALLQACASEPKYACGAPEGVGCKPVSEVYELSYSEGSGGEDNLLQETDEQIPKETSDANVKKTAEKTADKPEHVAAPTVQPGEPVLTPPRILRVWIAPWEDENRDLHSETYLYLRLEDGHWTLAPNPHPTPTATP